MRALAAILALTLALLLQPAAALAVAEVAVTPPSWPAESTYEFAIYDSQGNRVASAYYRILAEETGGRDAFRFKYMGKNDAMSESSECWVHRDTLLPMRSTRKVVSGGKTLFQDVAYGDKVIVVRKRYGSEPVNETELPGNGRFFDYEELIWLVPHLSFGEDKQMRIELFDTLTEMPTSVLVNDDGIDTLVIKEQSFPARVLSCEVSTVPYRFFVVNQDGVAVPGRIEMGSTTFVNLRLDPDKVNGAAAPAAEAPVVDEEPAEEQSTERDGLGAPPAGSRF